MRKLLSILFLLVPVFILVALAWPGFHARGEGVRRIDAEMAAFMVALDQYKERFGAYPKGDSASVCRALTGDNPTKTIFIELGPRSKTEKGELLDPWGTPYMIYFSGDLPLVRSAGKNKVFDATRDRECDDVFGG